MIQRLYNALIEALDVQRRWPRQYTAYDNGRVSGLETSIGIVRRIFASDPEFTAAQIAPASNAPLDDPDAKSQATRLARTLSERAGTPHFTPHDTLSGILDQIDHLTAAMVMPAERQDAPQTDDRDASSIIDPTYLHTGTVERCIAALTAKMPFAPSLAYQQADAIDTLRALLPPVDPIEALAQELHALVNTDNSVAPWSHAYDGVKNNYRKIATHVIERNKQ